MRYVAPVAVLLASGMAACFTPKPPEPSGQPFEHPGGFHSQAQLTSCLKQQNEPGHDAAWKQLIADADAALDRAPNPQPVVNIPAYYRNAQASQEAKRPLSDDAYAAYALALAAHLGPPEKRDVYAGKAIEYLDAWATTNTKVAGSDGHLVMVYAGVPFVHAGELVYNCPEWSVPGRDAFKNWVQHVFRPSALHTRKKDNNPGDWGLFGSLCAAHFLDDRREFDKDVARLKWRIEHTIADTGELPLENRRTNSGMWYTFFALAPMTCSAQVVQNTTREDIFRYTASNGRNIKMALDRFFTYCEAPETWPYAKPGGITGFLPQLLHPSAGHVIYPEPAWTGSLFEAMMPVFDEDSWEGWIAESRPIHGARGWIYPTLLPADQADRPRD